MERLTTLLGPIATLVFARAYATAICFKRLGEAYSEYVDREVRHSTWDYAYDQEMVMAHVDAYGGSLIHEVITLAVLSAYVD